MGKHEYLKCNKCKGKGYCENASNSSVFCEAYVPKNSNDKWVNPTIDVFDKLQQLKNGKRIIL